MPAIEIVTFEASEGLLANPDIAQGALDLVRNVDGFIAAYSGIQIADKKTGYLVVFWETVEHHKKLVASAEYPAVMAALKPAFGGPPTVHHIEFDGDASKAFEAPVTELIASKLKEGVTFEQIAQASAELSKNVKSAAGVHEPLISGEAVEKDGTFYQAIGWDSLEAYKAATSSDEVKALVVQLASQVDFKVAHVSFRKTG